MNQTVIDRAADNIRLLSAAMVEKAKSGHPGGAMGGADFINILYSEFLSFDPDVMDWPFRDRFFLDPGHMSPMLYSVLALSGTYSLEEIGQFRQWGSPTPGHPERNVMRGIENTSGPLGQGHTMAVGAALAERIMVDRFGDWCSHKTYTFISDGGVQEEISQGAGRIAGFLGLNNLIMFYDSNEIQLSTETSAVTSEDTEAKYKAWGWRVVRINGNDSNEIRNALIKANAEKEKPVLIIGHTIMGKGCIDDSGASFERQSSTHGMPISSAGASFEKTIANLGGDASDPIAIFPEVKEYYDSVILQKRAIAKQKRDQETKWRTENSQLADVLDRWLSGKLPEIDWDMIEQKSDIASRAASGTVMSYLADHLDNLIVMSGDLANSDKTDSYLKKTTPFSYHNFSGTFLHAGVSELTMASLANGLALHGGFIPACGTFFVFSDYMKPAVRMASLMELQVIYIWTHDAFRVGEDGPTHQPVEQEAQIRLLEQLKNHSGRPGVLVLRPADAQETTVCWKMAVANANTPTALLLSRQGIKDVPAGENSTRYSDALQAERGGYIVQYCREKPDVILVGNGSEVSTLIGGAQLLKERKGIESQVVSVPSEGLFNLQDKDYKKELFPDGVPVFGLTAGLPVTLRGLVGVNGKVVGLDHFGYSAPASVLDEKFGFTTENVFINVMKWLYPESD
ncbi:MAG: transketolase [Bacteroidales bacterium]|nr:transketolase [Bacteroidales bacterium]